MGWSLPTSAVGREPASRIWLAVFVGIAVLGIGILVASFRRGDESPDPGPPPGALDPEWLTEAPRKEDFTVLLKTATEIESVSEVESLLAAGTQPYAGVASVRSEWRLIRVLPEGFEFDSSLSLEATALADRATEMTLRVARGETKIVTYRSVIDEEGIRRLRYSSDPETEEFQDVEIQEDLPLSIGDLRLRDTLDLHAAADVETVRFLGSLDTFNSVELKVFELDLDAARNRDEDSGAIPDPNRKYEAHAATALLYCEAEELRPRTVRFFDRQDRLVRTYSGMIFERFAVDKESKPELTRFQVESIPDESTSMFHLESIRFEGKTKGTGTAM